MDAERLSFNRFAKDGISLPNRRKLVVSVRDDLSGLSGMEVVAQGFYT